MTTHFLSAEFTIADIPDCVAQHHRDNFEAVLRQREASDEAYQDAQEIEREIGPDPRGSQRGRLKTAQIWHRDERTTYEAMLQTAMEEMIDDYPYGFS